MDAPQIVKQATGPAIATDAENRILQLNPAARKLFGFDLRSARGRNFHRLLKIRDTFGNRLSAEPFAFYEMVSRSEPVSSFEVEVRKASGDPLRVAVSVIVVLGAEPEDHGLVYHLRPVYHRRKADEAIERILALRGVVDDEFVFVRGSSSGSAAIKLTSRQIEVLRLMARGCSAAEMATSLGVSVNTVRTHVQRILRRLGTHSQLEAVAEAYRLRLI